VFRPAVIQPLHGIRSRTTLYRILYAVTGVLLPLLKAVFPNQITTTERIGRAMIPVALRGYGKPILECADINAAYNEG
jgi:hypothetical protein